jgi:hypothetical protein
MLARCDMSRGVRLGEALATIESVKIIAQRAGAKPLEFRAEAAFNEPVAGD